MSDTVLFLTVRAQPGQRDALRALWDTHLRPRAADNPAQATYFYCYSDSDPDTIHMFEHYTDAAALAENAQAPFFADFLAEAAPLMAGAPEVAQATPVWIKK